MRIMKIFMPTAIAVSIALFSGCGRNGIMQKSLTGLDQELELKSTYEQAFVGKMEAMKALYDHRMSLEDRYRINSRLADAYSAYSFDSTMAYLDRNLQMVLNVGDKEKILETRLNKVKEYIQAGYHSEASNIMEEIHYEQIPYNLRALYFTVRHSLAGELMVYSRGMDLYNAKYAERNEMRDSLMNYILPGSFEWYDLNREAALSAKDSASVRDLTAKMLRLSAKDSRDYAKACYFYSEGVPRAQEDSIVYWLCKSAIADIRCATKDYAALNTIATLVFSNGDLERAFRYTANHCMQDALLFNGKLRPWQISGFFPDIERAYEHKQQIQERWMVGVIIVASFLLILLTFLLVEDWRHRTILSRTNDKLKSLYARIRESDKVKEEYIALFMGIVSDNINKTRKYQTHVLKYLKRGNDKYIIDEIEQMPPIEDDIRQFYKMFDQAFINLYPDFIEQFNALLADGEEITPKEQDILTPELRIFALIKLGVTDSGKIAALLHYSANTVYNYRAKIKKKAKGPKDKFEEEVSEIC